MNARVITAEATLTFVRRLAGVVFFALALAPGAGAATLVAVRPAATPLLERSVAAALVSDRLGVWKLDDDRLVPVLRRRGLLVASEPDVLLHSTSHITSGDPLLPYEWWIHAVGADLVEPPGPGRPVTVIDSGIDLTHPEFAGRPNTFALNPQTFDPVSPDPHGTEVSSVLGAPANGIGLVGVYPQVVLRSFDVGENRYSLADLVAGLDAALAQGPGVVTISLGLQSTEPAPVLELAIDRLFARGSLIVASAGNNGAGGGHELPADLPHVLTVGATDRQNAPASFSSRSGAVDLAAPGIEIPAATLASRDPSGYILVSGTSFSAPIVAGAAAWAWTVRPMLANTQLFELLRRSATDIGAPGFDQDTGFGLLNIPAALAAPAPPIDPQEPNEDVDDVSPGLVRRSGTNPLRVGSRLRASLDYTEDPRDVYRLSLPAGKAALVRLVPDDDVDLAVWRPKTASVLEHGTLRRRDLVGASARPGTAAESVVVRNRGKRTAIFYVAASLGAQPGDAQYALSVSASR